MQREIWGGGKVKGVYWFLQSYARQRLLFPWSLVSPRRLEEAVVYVFSITQNVSLEGRGVSMYVWTDGCVAF